MSREHITILLIEDNPGDARLIREMLPEGGGVGHSLEWVESLEAGLQRIAQGGIDLVLLDLGLPESMGLETLRHLCGRAAHLPAVVVMSSLADEAIAVQAVLEGAQDYLVKGQVDGSLLSRSIRYAIERNEATVALRRAHDELEGRVLERTATLTNAAKALQGEIAERMQAEEALHRLNRELRAISNCNQTLLRAEDEQTLLNEVCRIVCNEAGYRMAWVGFAERDEAKTVRPVAWAGLEDGYLETARIVWSDTERGRGPTGTAIRTGKTSQVRDFETDPPAGPWRREAARRGYRCSIGLPLKDETGAVFGAFTIYSAEPNAFTPDEIRLLEELAGDLAFGTGVLRGRNERTRNDAINASRLHLIQFAATHSLDELLEETLNEAEKLTGSLIGFYHFVEDDQISLTLQNWSTRTKAEFCKAAGKGQHYAISQAGVWVECVGQRKPVIHNDYASLPNRKGLPEGHATVIRELVAPVLRGEKITAILGVGNKPTEYVEKDAEAVSLLADLSWEIAERKRVDEALSKSEEKYRSLIQKLQTAVVVHAADTRIVTCNPVAQTLLGLTEDQLLGRTAIDPAWHFFREDGSAMPQEEYPVNRVLSTRQPLKNLVLGVHRPGNEHDVWAMVNANPVFSPENKISEIIVTFIDITERRQAQEKISHLAAIVESSDDAIIGKTLDETIVSWNRGAERIYGYAAGEIVGHSVSILVPSDLNDELAAIMERLKHGETIEHLETTRRRKDGRAIYVALTISPIKDARGKIVGASTIARDITERKRVDAALFFVAQRGWQTGAESFFDALAQFLGEELDMDYALIDRIDESPGMAETVALYARGVIAPNMRYALKGTPCENVMGRQLCVYRQGVQQLFPEDTLLPQMGAESYIGIPLWDSAGKPIGLIAVMGTKPFPDDAPVTQLLQLVATRAAAELERKRAEEAIRKLNAELEQHVKDRTAELEAKNAELQRMNKIFVGRELRMAELKERLRQLESPVKRGGDDSVQIADDKRRETT